ncbi:MFS transporter [Croceibacterium aestuarii]|uniref:MFS transporter n=1 Tax=Croceibacterium aestuarii TaxID=3064139 RepID=UPI00272EABD1|nr:MFS transporter [Croceibacterium sp. D39]
MTADSRAALPALVQVWGLVTVALCLAALVIDGLDYQLLALTAPLIMAEWAVARADFGTAMAAALFGMAFGAAGGGWLGDRIGRVRALALSVILFGCATMAVSRTGEIAPLAALRVLGGIGFGAAGPNALALACEWMPLRFRTYVVALLSVGTPAGGMIGAAALPALLPSLGWRGVFLSLGIAAVALGAVLVGVLRNPAHEARSAVGARSLLSAPFARLNIGVGLSFAALIAISYGLNAWMPSFLTAAGFTLEQALAASFAFNACSILGAFAAGWLARAQGSRRVMLGSAVLTAVLLVSFGVTLDAAPGARAAIDALAASVGFAASVGITTLYAMAALLYPPEVRAGGIGLGMTSGRIGGIAMSFAGGYLLDFADGSASVLFGVLAAAAIVATTAGWLVRRHIPAHGLEVS